MSARNLLDNLKKRGVTMTATPHGNIRCKPKSALQPSDVERIKECKAELLALIRSTAKDIRPSPPSLPSSGEGKPDIYGESAEDDPGYGYGDDTHTTVPSATELDRAAARRAARLGLIARWSYEYGFISLHDPTAGEWHDVAVKDAPRWAKSEAFLRKRLRREKGIERLLDRSEIEELLVSELPAMWLAPATLEPGRRLGLVYDDELPPDDALEG